MAAPFTLSSAKKGSNPSPAKAFAFVSNSRPFLAFSNASFVQFDSSNQEVFFARPSFLLYNWDRALFAGRKEEIYLSIVFPGRGEREDCSFVRR